ncbi:hypothetical protein FRC10_012044, partial [Ceratobasidium sp. 414]
RQAKDEPEDEGLTKDRDYYPPKAIRPTPTSQVPEGDRSVLLYWNWIGHVEIHDAAQRTKGAGDWAILLAANEGLIRSDITPDATCETAS